MGRIRIKVNKNLDMSPGKAAAQAVHAALELFGIHPGYAVVVLQGTLTQVKDMEAVIIDEGRTEIKPGSTTAGASFEFSAEHDGDKSLERHRLDLAYETYQKAKAALDEARQAYFAAPHYYKEQYGLDITNE